MRLVRAPSRVFGLTASRGGQSEKCEKSLLFVHESNLAEESLVALQVGHFSEGKSKKRSTGGSTWSIFQTDILL